MGDESIERMIAETLQSLEEPRARAGPRLVHDRVILDQYVALCGGEATPGSEQTANVALPIAPAREVGAPARPSQVASVARRMLARVRGRR